MDRHACRLDREQKYEVDSALYAYACGLKDAWQESGVEKLRDRIAFLESRLNVILLEGDRGKYSPETRVAAGWALGLRDPENLKPVKKGKLP